MPSNLDDSSGYVCCQCEKHSNSPANFYKTNSTLYTNNGYLPICKDCLNKLFGIYTTRYGSQVKAMKRICMAYDLYFSQTLFDKCDCGSEATLGTYIKMLNMVQYRAKTFDNTLSENFVFNDAQDYVEKPKASAKTESKDIEEENEYEVTQEDIQKWGGGLSPIDYSDLNDHYTFLKNANPNCDSNQEIFIVDLCYTKMLQRRAIRDGNPDTFGKMSEQYRKTFEKAGLKTVRDASADEDFTMGINIETIEKYTPSEYYKNKELYKGYDDIGDYIDRFLLRPLRNLQFGSSDRDHEFYVKDEEEVDEYSEDE